MDYDALASLLPTPAATWNEQHVARWLHFVHLDALVAPFGTPPPMQPPIVSTAHACSHSPRTTCTPWESPTASSSAN